MTATEATIIVSPMRWSRNSWTRFDIKIVSSPKLIYAFGHSPTMLFAPDVTYVTFPQRRGV
jgi:hypothetical protein